MNQPISPNFQSQLGVLIGLGCPKCGKYITVEFVEPKGYEVVCGNCGYEYWITFRKEALEAAAPQLLAACVRLVGTLMRDTDSVSVGSVGYEHVRQALTAIAEATGYPRHLWAQLDEEIARATQEVKQVRGE